jgi:hypothetical protein
MVSGSAAQAVPAITARVDARIEQASRPASRSATENDWPSPVVPRDAVDAGSEQTVCGGQGRVGTSVRPSGVSCAPHAAQRQAPVRSGGKRPSGNTQHG